MCKRTVIYVITIYDLDGDVATRFSDKSWIGHDSVMSVLTHVYLQSWNISIQSALYDWHIRETIG